VKKFLRAIPFLLIISVIIYMYARFIEPNMLKFHYENISSTLIESSSDGIKILQFSDLHISDYFNIEDLEEVVDKINDENPDIVIFTGDLIDHYNNYIYKGEISQVWEALGHINAPLGKYAVYGNHDYGGGAEKVYSKIMENSGFVTLVNDSVKLDEYKLNIVGLDDSIFGDIDYEKLGTCIQDDYFNIVISHEPDVIDSLLEYNIDMFLSGHSHGGQVNIPFFSSSMLPSLGEKYVKGLYKFENSRNTILYVNIGIGTSHIPFRFMAAPELSVFTLKNK